MRYFLFLLLSVLFLKTNAQSTQRHDSLVRELAIDSAHTYRPKNFRFILAYDSRLSYIRNAPVNFFGLQVGVSYKDVHTWGVGAYKISQSFNPTVRKREVNSRIINEQLTLNYATVFYQYMLLNKKYLELDLPVETGYGKAMILETDAAKGELISNRSFQIFPIGVGLQAIVKPIKWVGITFLAGYRFVPVNDRRINFNGMYYSIGLWLDFRQVIRDIKFYGFQKPKFRKGVHKLENARLN
jgi:hypothetical protein